jgi:hypothetical protein
MCVNILFSDDKKLVNSQDKIKIEEEYAKKVVDVIKSWADTRARPINMSLIHLLDVRGNIFPLIK